MYQLQVESLISEVLGVRLFIYTILRMHILSMHLTHAWYRFDIGLYDTLKPSLITATAQQRALMEAEPMAVVTWDMFQQTQFPYMEVRRPFILGTKEKKWKATIAHRFFELLYAKTGKLTRLYTQNIDG